MFGIRSARHIGLALVVIAVSVTGFATTASATLGGEQGLLLIHGPGSLYSGTQTVATQEGSPGSTISYAIKVKNTGSSNAQFALHLEAADDSCACIPTPALLVGNVNVTTSATSTAGYYTIPISPGTTTPLTLRVTVPKAAMPGDFFEYNIFLADSNENVLDQVGVLAQVTETKGTTDADLFVTTSGQKTVGTNIYDFGAVGVVEKTGGTASFTAKLANDSTTPSQIQFTITSDTPQCNAGFPIVVKAGSADITAQALQPSTYVTKVLAAHASVTLSVKITYRSTSGCPGAPLAGFYTAQTFADESSQSIDLFVSAAQS